MKDVRIGNDISVIWSLYSYQKPFLLDGLKISVYLKWMYGKTKIEDYTIKGNKIHWTFFGKDQKHTGKYSLTLVVNEGAEGMVTTDVCDLVRLVSCTCQADGTDEDGVQTETIAVNSEVELLSGEIGRIDTALDPMSENAVQNKVITEELNNKVDKVSGKQLSTEDFTTELKLKLEGMNLFDPTEINNKVDNLQTQITNKQDTIADLDIIRGGAALGATALQRIDYQELEDNLIDSGFYHSPDGMLYRSDMEDAVQESLDKADSALQSENDPIFSASPAASITTEKMQEWDAKQDLIADIETIRSGAEKGATALQSIPSEYVTEKELNNAIATSITNTLNTEV